MSSRTQLLLLRHLPPQLLLRLPPQPLPQLLQQGLAALLCHRSPRRIDLLKVPIKGNASSGLPHAG
jgi:hypothetical protein